MKKTKLILIIILGSFICNAQNWKSGVGISNQIVRDIIEYNKDTLIAGVEKNGVFVSYDNGNNWTQFALKGETVYSLIKIGKSIIAGTNGHDIYKTASINSTWKKININALVISALKLHNDTIFACSYSSTGPGAVYFSVDTGNTWQQFSINPHSPSAYLDIDFNPNGRIYVATPMGTYYSDKQSAWIPTTGQGTTTWTVNHIGKDSIIYGCETGDIYLSKDNGVSSQKWSNISGRRTFFIDDTIYVAGNDLMYSKSLSEDWKYMNLNRNVKKLTKIQNKLFAATTEGVYIYGDGISEIHNINKIPITIFPNPTTGIFELNGIGSEKFSLEIINSKGQQVLKSQSLQNDISDFEPGLYILRIDYRNSTIVKKIVKK